MKLVIIVLLVISCLTSCSKEIDVRSINEFQRFLLRFWDTNKDGILSWEEKQRVTWINVPCLNVIDGLENFLSLYFSMKDL